MANPITTNIAISNATTLFITVDTYAAYSQKATIVTPSAAPFNGQTLTATGSGEGNRVFSQSFAVSTPGIYTFKTTVQYNDGSGYKNSTDVAAASFSAETLNETVLFSEDSNDDDNNDCLVTFMWFGSQS